MQLVAQVDDAVTNTVDSHTFMCLSCIAKLSFGKPARTSVLTQPVMLL